MLEIPLGGGKKIQLDFPEITTRTVLIGAGLLLALVGGVTSFYTVQADEEGVVLRFGKYQSTQSPGLHFKMPFFIDRVEKVEVLRQMKQEFGFGTGGNTNRFQYVGDSEQEQEKKMVTGDLNAARVEWVIQYRITEPKDYLFQVRNAEIKSQSLHWGQVLRKIGNCKTPTPTPHPILRAGGLLIITLPRASSAGRCFAC